MVNKSKSFARKQSSVRKSSNRTQPKVRLFLGIIFALLFLGITRIWLGNLHERTASKILALEKEHRNLTAENGIIRSELLNLSQYTRIEDIAHRKLKMVAPRTPPDTVWCPEVRQSVMMSSLVFFTDLQNGD
ncbi:cell division protein FtsL [bacterium]|nr:cell division protein FtsL [bacterium]